MIAGKSYSDFATDKNEEKIIWILRVLGASPVQRQECYAALIVTGAEAIVAVQCAQEMLLAHKTMKSIDL